MHFSPRFVSRDCREEYVVMSCGVVRCCAVLCGVGYCGRSRAVAGVSRRWGLWSVAMQPRRYRRFLYSLNALFFLMS